MSATDGGQAFPGRKLSHYVATADGGADPVFVDSDGMSLRDWFAGQALAGITANAEESKGSKGISYQADLRATAKVAFDLADAMIAERSKP